MNRRHRIVFNAASRQMVALSEAATACTPSPGQTDAGAGAAQFVMPRSRWQLLRMSTAVLLACGRSLLWPAHAQIVADPSARGRNAPPC